MTIREIGALLRSRKLSCVELLDDTFAAIKDRDKYNCFITQTEETARKTAQERDQELAAGLDRGPFHGVLIAYKDLFYTRGVRTTAGSPLYGDFIPTYDGTVVARLETAGAISVGKTNLHELAYGITSKNPHFGPVLNPRDTTRIPGGSSGGSAALVAAGLLPMCLGSDTGGSIRIPASFCGIVGLKPTYGRVSRYGVLPLAFSLDHMGPLASPLEDCALTMNAIAGPDPLDASCASEAPPDFNVDALRSFSGVRVGIAKNFFFDRVDPSVKSAVLHAVVDLMQPNGAHVTHLQIPDMAEINAASLIVQLAEVASLYGRHSDARMIGEDVWTRIQQGKAIAGHEYVNAQRLRTVFRREFDALWREIDVLVAPTTPIAAPVVDQATVQIGTETEDTRMAATRLVRGINFLGEPALSIPCGSTSEGLPIGLQLIGRPFSEPRLLQIGKSIERLLS
ncbi:MAG: Asp-tRNA(Asn)/Glu-tRNA(Gln) amidotransferase subunit GatA [Acidobacteriaceae bacterium]|nr:Asp-tRNA(Asn)/Glu-tRNA(Gln) amidotransferase subunit GatA [Acidobacteriaceae bacterium]